MMYYCLYPLYPSNPKASNVWKHLRCKRGVECSSSNKDIVCTVWSVIHNKLIGKIRPIWAICTKNGQKTLELGKKIIQGGRRYAFLMHLYAISSLGSSICKRGTAMCWAEWGLHQGIRSGICQPVTCLSLSCPIVVSLFTWGTALTLDKFDSSILPSSIFSSSRDLTTCWRTLSPAARALACSKQRCAESANFQTLWNSYDAALPYPILWWHDSAHSDHVERQDWLSWIWFSELCSKDYGDWF